MTKYLSFTFVDLELKDLEKHKSYHVVSGGDEMLDTVIVNCTYSRAQLTYSYFKTGLYTSFEQLPPPPPSHNTTNPNRLNPGNATLNFSKIFLFVSKKSR